MDPISSAQFAAPVSPSARVEPPAPPDASDVERFQEIYHQEPGQAAQGVQSTVPNDGAWISMQMPQEISQVPDSLFHTAMERLMETHEKGSIAIESLFEHMDGGGFISPAELLRAQVALSEATTGLTTFQTFDKKTDEGLKALLTGQ